MYFVRNQGNLPIPLSMNGEKKENISKHPLVDKNSVISNHKIIINGINFTDNFVTIFGPCAIESKEVIFESAKELSKIGIKVMRGGCWKPRTSPYDFQGEGEDALRWAVEACLEFGIKIFVTEVISIESDVIINKILKELDPKGKLVVMRQVGTRNAQNFALLTYLGSTNNPVLLKRGMANTIDEFLSAAEYLLAGGNNNVVLCLRGHRLSESHGNRFALDYEDTYKLKRLTHLPVIYDPSHSTGDKNKVIPISFKAINCGINGLIIDVHPNPSIAKCDSTQALVFSDIVQLL